MRIGATHGGALVLEYLHPGVLLLQLVELIDPSAEEQKWGMHVF